MKKSNKLMRASSILLVLTLITSCFVGGTFAKFFSEDEGSDTARVAKWGVEVEVANGEAFQKYYGKDDATTDVTTQIGGKYISVNSKDKVVAPGTTGNFGGYDSNGQELPVISFSGEPEVAAQINTEVTIGLGSEEDWSVQGSFYCPLVFTIFNSDGDRQVICGLHYSGSNGGYGGFIGAIQKALKDQATKVVEAGENLGDYEVYCSWAWPFENGKHIDYGCNLVDNGKTNGHDMDQSDTLDSDLGDKAAQSEIPEISLTVETTVTQVN